MWPFRWGRKVPETDNPKKMVPAPEPELGGVFDRPGTDDAEMSDAEFEAFLREQERFWAELERKTARMAEARRGRAPNPEAVEMMRCTACGIYGEHLLDRDGFPVECRSCGWEGGAV